MMKDVIQEILITPEDILNKCKELGAQITKDYTEQGTVPYVVGLLRGSVPFMADLMKYLDMDIQIDFMDVSSYQGSKSTGHIRINKDLECNVEGMSILLVEDIVDTGRTFNYLMNYIKEMNPKSVKSCVLLDKKARRVIAFEADYVGFSIEDLFVIGRCISADFKAQGALRIIPSCFSMGEGLAKYLAKNKS